MKRGIKIAIGVLLFAGFLFLFVIPTKTTTITYDLPPPIIPAKPAHRAPIFVEMKPDGGLTIEGAPTTLEALPRDLAARFGDVPKDQQRVMIRAPEDVPYDRFMAVLSTLQGRGWYKVGLVNEAVPHPKP
ncbi:biopolymer transporter ExbD [Caulobacter sp. SSI4214]|uniref:ExbD/TolR family protein n=1 Tax=Caulobacter sp. SSI4214 TaxID=2575739 RepID=UPI00143A5698|nr:biopolymer transporter ExbD [Caulobacter sp. SSI4214]